MYPKKHKRFMGRFFHLIFRDKPVQKARDSRTKHDGPARLPPPKFDWLKCLFSRSVDGTPHKSL